MERGIYNLIKQARITLREFQLFQQLVQEKYGENVPPELLKEMREEIDRFREKNKAMMRKLFPPTRSLDDD